MEINVKEWVVQWFAEHVGIETEVIKENLDVNFFHNGWIDSFQFINFISDIEDEFDITFSNDEFQDRSFASINGISISITNKL